MADTTNKTKEALETEAYYNTALATVDKDSILSKYNAIAEKERDTFNTNLANTENAFYRQMYQTNRTAMDAIRQSNAQAVATGASRGMMAANQLATILGLGDTNATAATELAQSNSTAAAELAERIAELGVQGEEAVSAAVQNLIQSMIQTKSINAQTEAAQIAADAQNAQTNVEQDRLALEAVASGLSAEYDSIKSDTGLLNSESNFIANYPTNAKAGTLTPAEEARFNNIINKYKVQFNEDTWKGSNTGAEQVEKLISGVDELLASAGVNKSVYLSKVEAMLRKKASDTASWLKLVDFDNKNNKFDGMTAADKALFDLDQKMGKAAYAQLVNIYQTIYFNELKKVLQGNPTS